MRHLKRIANHISVIIPPDSDGFTGRECPNLDCEGYFKIEFGTGLEGDSLPCNCPYCGHSGPHDNFWTPAQIEYAQSVAIRKISDAIFKDLKSLEFDSKPRGTFGIGLSMKVKRGRPIPIRSYREEKLETTVICDGCTLRYAIYGVFALCPDCAGHNSYQILTKNLELARKQICLAGTLEDEMSRHLIEDALENAVSTFDGFGREICRVKALQSSDPPKAEKVSFQNIAKARQKVIDLFNLDFAATLDAQKWDLLFQAFMKRHVLAHRMGVVDQKYIDITGDSVAIVGRKIPITSEQVAQVLGLVSEIGKNLHDGLP
jgi:hypothetical protein